mmetsp:Transcript_17266/g.17209  ORF Transcript_17266/g.17209 Transcript_17266/m.17209 type:complete len:190 (+) Transcript_17266:51-620(+)
MSDKLLQEFLVRLTRTRTAVSDTKKQCDFLKKEAKRLEQELESLEKNKSELLQIEENLKVHYISTKVQNEEEFEKNSYEHEELLKLRKIKRLKQREKEKVLKDVERLTNELNQLVRQREQLEGVAKSLNSKLDQASAERIAAEQEAKRNAEILRSLTSELAVLNAEKDSLNKAVANTFEEELRSAKRHR